MVAFYVLAVISWVAGIAAPFAGYSEYQGLLFSLPAGMGVGYVGSELFSKR